MLPLLHLANTPNAARHKHTHTHTFCISFTESCLPESRHCFLVDYSPLLGSTVKSFLFIFFSFAPCPALFHPCDPLFTFYISDNNVHIYMWEWDPNLRSLSFKTEDFLFWSHKIFSLFCFLTFSTCHILTHVVALKSQKFLFTFQTIALITCFSHHFLSSNN